MTEQERSRGGAFLQEGRVYARVRYGKGERVVVRVPGAKTLEEGAARAEVIAELTDRLVEAGRRDMVKATATAVAEAATEAKLDAIRRSIAKGTKGLKAVSVEGSTFYDVAESWVSGELRKKFPDYVRRHGDFKGEVGRLKRYIYPHVKHVPMTAFSKAHADLVMRKLPAKRVKTSAARRHVAQIMVRVCNLAVMPLGIIPASPLPRGFLPRIENGKHYSCLFPREEAMILGCKQIDEAFRLFVGILSREGMRVEELAESEWWQWNLHEGIFTATKTKTHDPRFWALRKDVADAMRIWEERHGSTGARPFVDVVDDSVTRRGDKKDMLTLAARVREACGAAGIKRPELFENTETTAKLRAHDLRATFVTVSLAEGKSDTWIRDRTAHKTMHMVDRYRRAARQIEELQLGGLVDLVQGLGWARTWARPAKVVGE